MKVLVVTVVHDPRDARIAHREIQALLDAGHAVTYAAAFTAYDAHPPAGVRRVDLPRSRGRRRMKGLREARRVIRREAPDHDVVLIHDPELLLAVEGLRGPVVVWDVHEDTAAAVTLKPWLPGPARRATSAAMLRVESRAENRHRLILAEDGYRGRFSRVHPVVPNSTPAPDVVLPSGADRVVYVGSITLARGAAEMVELGRLLEREPVEVHLVGSADVAATELLKPAHEAGFIVWHGFQPNDKALALVDGALAGLSLLHDEANYRHSRPTKIIEYMAHAVPVITTPSPPARALVEEADCGLVVPFDDAPAAAAAVLQLIDDPQGRQAMADRGRAAALRDHDWRRDGMEFVRVLEEWVAQSPHRSEHHG